MEKGFTLIELLAVLIILAIISSISIVVVNKTMTNSKKNISDIQKSNIEDTAEIYYLKEGMNENVTCVNVSYLIENGYFDAKEIKNPENSEAMNGSVKISYEANQYSYKYQDKLCE